MNQGNFQFNPLLFNMMLNQLNLLNPNSGYNINNYNNYDQQYKMNLMFNWMKMNPFLVLLYNSMLNQNNNFNNNNHNNNNMNYMNVSQSGLNQAKVSGGGENFDLTSLNDDCPSVNVVFTTQKGNKMNITCPFNMKIKDLFVKYVTRQGLGPGIIGDSFFFLYNGTKLNHKDNRTIGEIGINSGYNIIVIDIKDIMGS